MAAPSLRAPAAVVEIPGMYLRAWEELPGVAMTLSIGRATIKGARAYVGVFEQTIERSGSLFVVSDASRLIGYDAGVRELYTDFYRDIGDAFRGLHILVSTGMVKMAVTLINHGSGGRMVQHTDREVFERAVLAQCPGLDLTPFRTLPTEPVPTPRARIAP